MTSLAAFEQRAAEAEARLSALESQQGACPPHGGDLLDLLRRQRKGC